ncbi:MAG: OsmC family protein [Candidatus Omnitrophica bacterium]|nr:OsmC family protein [Candidatus Omnitrophota bacterium]
MPAKDVYVELVQEDGFKTEARAGKHPVLIDQPGPFGGTDSGPTPLDYQLIALGGCIAHIARIVARQRNLTLQGLRIAVEGHLNTDRLLGKPAGERVGFSNIKVRVTLEADWPREQKEAFLKEVEQRCPISDNLVNSTLVTVELTG